MSFRACLKSVRKSLSGRSSPRRPKTIRSRLRVETLEDRMLLSAVVFSSDGRALAIDGGPANENIDLSVEPSAPGRLRVQFDHQPPQFFSLTNTINHQPVAVQKVIVNGEGGADTVTIRKLPASLSVEVTTDSLDTVTVGDAARLDNFLGNVFVIGPATVQVDDSATPATVARNVIIRGPEIFTDVTFHGLGRISASGDADLTVLLGAGDDNVTVSSPVG